DKHHQRYERLVTDLSATGLLLLTTWPCIVEASYLLDIPQRFEMLHWIELGGALVHPFEPHDLGDIISWMQRYSINLETRAPSSRRSTATTSISW
ncbi:MAG: hypothetical protein ACREV8_06315, partial [Gammaproteobacteria bacterium]